MDIILKSFGIALVTVVICLFVNKQNKDVAILISIVACCGILLSAMQYLDNILLFVNDLKIIGNIDVSFLGILLKAVGIGLIAEITSLICTDAGNAALGKSVQILATCGILWLSIPLFTSLIDLLNKILGEV